MPNQQVFASKPQSAPRLLSYQQLDILHALRGFCAFYVVVYHAKFVLWVGGTAYLQKFPRASWHWSQFAAFLADTLASAGYEMVIFFFVLSGFFIRYAQLKKHRPALNFYLNRIYRIYPPYLASLVLGGAILAYLALRHPHLLSEAFGRELNTSLLAAWHELQTVTLTDVGRVLLFDRPGQHFFGYNQVYWSLAPEAMFYLLVPLAFRRAHTYYVLSAAFHVFGLLAVYWHYLIANPVLGYLLTYNGYFALGAATYDLVTTRPAWLQRFRLVSGPLLALGTGGLFLALIGTAALHLRIVSMPLAALLAVVSVSVLLAGRVSPHNFLVRAFHKIGLFSFSLYLYHFPLLLLCYTVLVAATKHVANYPRYYWLALPLVTAGCYALYLVTERLAVRYFRGS